MILQQDTNWVIITPDDAKDLWWESEAYVKVENTVECRCSFGGQPRFMKEAKEILL